MSKANKLPKAEQNDDYGPGFQLEGVKVHDALQVNGKVTGYWSIKESQGLELTFYPKLNGVLFVYGEVLLLIPTANIPYMKFIKD